MISGDLPLTTRHLIGILDVIGGEICKTKSQ